MSKAQNMDSLIKAHQDWAGSIPFSNTIATSVDGKAWYADSSPVPNINKESLAAWKKSLQTDPGKAALSEFHGIYVLDGSISRDEWLNDQRARKPGLIPFEQAPQLLRSDFVFNSNDSHWLTNPKHLLEGYSPLFGEERKAPSLRTRMNALELNKGKKSRKFTLESVQAAALSNKSLTGILLRKELVKRCKAKSSIKIGAEQIDLKAACQILANWDEHFDLNSRGAVLFREFLGAFEAESTGHEHTTSSAENRIFANPFKPNVPLTTPNGLALPKHKGNDPILTALGKAIQELNHAGIALDTPLSNLQFSKKNAKKIPIHGGQGPEGIMNMAAYSGSNGTLFPSASSGNPINPSTGLSDEGYVVNYGTSFLMAVELTPEGPNCQAVLAFSESADPDSLHFSDQTELFSKKQWRPCLFKQTEIQADPTMRSYTVANTKPASITKK
jgi:acyl-homoserine-lactone acylase